MEIADENNAAAMCTETERARRESLASVETTGEDFINGVLHQPIPTANSKRWRTSMTLPPGIESTLTSDADTSQKMKRRAGDFLESPKCDFLLGVIITANAVNIGIEQTYRATGEYASTAAAFEHLFLSIYTTELLVRFFAFGPSCFKDNWVRFDLLLVAMGITTQWIIQPIVGDMSEVGPVMVLRSARLMRLAKTVKLLINFRELWMLVQGLLSSANTMLYTLLLIFAILYMFACLGMELLYEHPLVVGPDRDEEFAWNVEEYFRSIPIAMLSLLQFVCWDNPVLVYRPLAQGGVFLCLYFLAVILVVGIVVMNLVTAVIVNSALEQTAANKHLLKAEEEKRKKKILKDLRKMFQRLDEDGSGQLSRDEITSVDESEMEVLKNLTSMEDPVEIFDVLDVDGSGDIEIDEFCDGLWEVAISKTPLEVKRMEKQVERIRQDTKSRALVLYDIKGRIEAVSKQISKLSASPGGKHRNPVCGCNNADFNSRSSGKKSSTFALPEVRSSVLEVLKEFALSDDSPEQDRDGSPIRC
eukprot:TRINITY_DN22811_c0_g1_i1.p1 TRINITY_DN22811_c0_g1~~TRINITY_DN22811_c0_g1_i1.p1  ORF type:complete len:531 (-),score=94.10 TRINITY_DN22811_c0_g1_i1:82-1674(-)